MLAHLKRPDLTLAIVDFSDAKLETRLADVRGDERRPIFLRVESDRSRAA
ncbi:MAG: hypothetical protein NT090_27655 [Acidobacteria bacterium]|nr:hypothetical protein [Acidobacteriota bacterium]